MAGSLRENRAIQSGRWRPAAAAFAVIAAVWLAYSSGLAAPFIMDDFLSIHANQSIRKLWPIWPVLFYPPGDGWTCDARPLLNLSLAINRAVTGMSPAGFRVVNVLIHCGNAVLFMALARELLERPAVPAAVRARALEIAFAATLFWAVHPLGTGAVTYIIQRAESLGAFMMLATVLTAVRGILAADSHKRTSVLPLVFLAAALAGTAKETAVVIPLVTVLIDRALLSCSWRGTLRHWPWHLAAAASWPSVAVMLTVWGGRGTSAGFGSGMSPWLYLLTQAKAIWLYVVGIVWPQGLVFDYGDFLSSGLADSGGWLMLTAAVFAGVVYGYATFPVAFLGPLLFFVLLGPTSSVIPLKNHTIALYRAYLPSAMVILPTVAAAWLFARERLALSPRICGLAVGLIGTALGAATAASNREFLEPEILWRKSLAAEPRNERAILNLARELIMKKDLASLAEAEQLLLTVAANGRRPETLALNLAALEKARGRSHEAISALTAALKFLPRDAHARADRGFLHWKVGRPAEALADLDAALALDEELPSAWLNRGNVLLDLGQQGEAERSFARSVEIDSRYAPGWNHLGIALQARSAQSNALEAYNRAVVLDPGYAEAVYNRGRLLAETGRLAEAIADFTVAIEAQPLLRDAHYNRAVLLLELGRTAEGRADLQTFVRLGGIVPPAMVGRLRGKLP